jgi:amino acid transporter
VRPDDGASEPALARAIGPKLLLFFVIGDVLGTGIYALTGDVAVEVGGAAWLAFGLAFLVALFTATSYVELVGKYPRAAGAALYVERAFGIRFLTFLVAFAVMCSGLTSAGAASRAFAGYLGELAPGVLAAPAAAVAVAFLLLLSTLNFIGVSEAVKTNVVLTCIELTGLLIVIAVGAVFVAGGSGDVGRSFAFEPGGNPFALVASGAGLAFFALVGFEDSVNMVEETTDPERAFPRALFLGITVAAVIYMLVAFFTTAVVPLERLAASESDLLEVVRLGAAWFPLGLFALISMAAVTNSALINLMMASRLVYGMSREKIIPAAFGVVHAARRTPWIAILFTAAVVIGLASWGGVRALGGTTALLLLGVFTLVNVAVLVLRGKPVAHAHYRAPTVCPVLGAISSAYLASPWSGRASEEYGIAGVLLAVAILLWGVNRMFGGAGRA